MRIDGNLRTNDRNYKLLSVSLFTKNGMLQQFNSLPTPSESFVGDIVQYIGNSTQSLTKGAIYVCEYISGNYLWTLLSIGCGITLTDVWNSLSTVKTSSSEEIHISHIPAFDNYLPLSAGIDKKLTGSLYFGSSGNYLINTDGKAWLSTVVFIDGITAYSREVLPAGSILDRIPIDTTTLSTQNGLLTVIGGGGGGTSVSWGTEVTNENVILTVNSTSKTLSLSTHTHTGVYHPLINTDNKLSVNLINGLSTVATSGSYNDLSNKPSIPNTTDDLTEGSTNLYFTNQRAINACSSIFLKLDGTSIMAGNLNMGNYQLFNASSILSNGGITAYSSNAQPSGSILDNIPIGTGLSIVDGILTAIGSGGTVTSITMNQQSYTPTSGVINLGTVITAHQTLPKYDSNVMTSSTNIPLVKTSTWDNKYDKPANGIPKTDLSNAVQASLGLADTAVQDTDYKHITVTNSSVSDGTNTFNKYTHPTGGANTTISAANGKVLSAITVNNLGHVTSVSSKTLAFADIPNMYIGTTAVQSTSQNQALTGITTGSFSLQVSASSFKTNGSSDVFSDGYLTLSGDNEQPVPVIQFHYGGSQSYTVRLAEEISGLLCVRGNLRMLNNNSNDIISFGSSTHYIDANGNSVLSSVLSYGAITAYSSDNQPAGSILDNIPIDTSTLQVVNGTLKVIAGSGVGSVTSVGLTVPTGFSITGSPITSSGTLAISFASGYSLPTTAKQTEWDSKSNVSWGTAGTDYIPLSVNNVSKNLLTSHQSLASCAKVGQANNLIHYGNEFTFASPAYSGIIHINYRTSSGNTDGNISNYLLCDGKGGVLFNLSTIASNASNGNTAFGWGNHADAGYLTISAASSTYLPFIGGTMSGEINMGLNRIKFNSSIKNDLIDDRTSGLTTFSISNPESSTVGYIGILSVNDYYKFQLGSYGGDGVNKNTLFYRGYDGNNTSWNNWVRIYHSGNLTKSTLGLGNVENKSSATIRSELTSSNVTTALGYTPYNSTNPNGYITSSGSCNYASYAGNAKTIDSNSLSVSGTTVADYKSALNEAFAGTYGFGYNISVPDGLVNNWSNDSATVTHSSTYSFVKISGAYNGNTYCQFLLTSYENAPIYILGKGYNGWGALKKIYHSGNCNNTTTTWNASSLTLNGAISGATTGSFSGNVSVGGTLSVTNAVTINTGINLTEGKYLQFRLNNNNYYTTLRYDTVGNEALILGIKNSVTSFIVKSGDSGTTAITTTGFTTSGFVPSIQVKGLSLYVNSLIANGVTPAYNFYVNGTTNITGHVNLESTLHASGIIYASVDTATTISVRAGNSNGTISLLTATDRGIYDNTNDTWLIGTTGTNTYLIDGNVGIGTRNPLLKLHVNGTILANSGITSYYSGTLPSGSILDNIPIDGTLTKTNGMLSVVGGGGGGGSWSGGTVTSSIIPSTTNQLNLGNGSNRWSAVFANQVSIGTGWFQEDNYDNMWAYPSDSFHVNGDVYAGDNDNQYSMYASYFREYSDERKKHIISEKYLSLSEINSMRSVLFNFYGKQNVRYGTIAQDVLNVFPLVIATDKNGYYSLDYGNLAVGLSLSLGKIALTHEERIEELEDRILELQAEIALLKS